ncbi:MAG: hypothetical protein V4568_06890 [Pseudomonadota bacterium]
MNRSVYYAIPVLLLGACASFPNFPGLGSQSKYVEPESFKASAFINDKSWVDSAIIGHNQVVTFDRVISATQKSDFVLESTNRNTWMIQLRYTGDPKNYIDCGRIVSRVKTPKGEHKYEFPAAKAYQQYQIQRDDKLYFIDRRMALDISAVITFEVLSPSRTRVKVDTQYTATRDQSYQDSSGKPTGMTDRVTFGLRDASATFSNAATKCRATGQFELDLLALAKR